MLTTSFCHTKKYKFYLYFLYSLYGSTYKTIHLKVRKHFFLSLEINWHTLSLSFFFPIITPFSQYHFWIIPSFPHLLSMPLISCAKFLLLHDLLHMYMFSGTSYPIDLSILVLIPVPKWEIRLKIMIHGHLRIRLLKQQALPMPRVPPTPRTITQCPC